MQSFEFLLELFGGFTLLILFGCLIGHLLRLDKFSDDQQKSKQIRLRETDVLIKEPGDSVKDNE